MSVRASADMCGHDSKGQCSRNPAQPTRGAAALLVLAVLCAGAVPAAAAPPKVIGTEPSNRQVDVDPALGELRVEFDQDMDPQGFSWAKFGPAFPTVAGKPAWKDRRTCLLPVKLEPGRAYTVAVNSVTLRGFRSNAAEPAEPHVFSFLTAAADGKPATTLRPEANAESVRQLREAIEQKYSYRDLRGVDWARQFERHTPDLRGAWTSDAFAAELTRLLAPALDDHMSVNNAGLQLPSARREYAPNFSVPLLARVVPEWRQLNPIAATGRFEDGTGYLLIASWDARNTTHISAVLDALRGFADAERLIVDVRPNGGGNEMLARQVASCFATETKVYAKHAYRDPLQPTGFAPPVSRTLAPTASGPKIRGRVAVLMGPANLSSCEAFLLMMKQTPRCKLVGATSGGSSGNPQPVTLANGVVVNIPSWQAMLPDGTVFEGKGIEPDLRVVTTPADFRTRDPVLDAAIDWLRRDMR